MFELRLYSLLFLFECTENLCNMNEHRKQKAALVLEGETEKKETKGILGLQLQSPPHSRLHQDQPAGDGSKGSKGNDSGHQLNSPAHIRNITVQPAHTPNGAPPDFLSMSSSSLMSPSSSPDPQRGLLPSAAQQEREAQRRPIQSPNSGRIVSTMSHSNEYGSPLTVGRSLNLRVSEQYGGAAERSSPVYPSDDSASPGPVASWVQLRQAGASGNAGTASPAADSVMGDTPFMPAPAVMAIKGHKKHTSLDAGETSGAESGSEDPVRTKSNNLFPNSSPPLSSFSAEIKTSQFPNSSPSGSSSGGELKNMLFPNASTTVGSPSAASPSLPSHTLPHDHSSNTSLPLHSADGPLPSPALHALSNPDDPSSDSTPVPFLFKKTSVGVRFHVGTHQATRGTDGSAEEEDATHADGPQPLEDELAIQERRLARAVHNTSAPLATGGQRSKTSDGSATGGSSGPAAGSEKHGVSPEKAPLAKSSSVAAGTRRSYILPNWFVQHRAYIKIPWQIRWVAGWNIVMYAVLIVLTLAQPHSTSRMWSNSPLDNLECHAGHVAGLQFVWSLVGVHLMFLVFGLVRLYRRFPMDGFKVKHDLYAAAALAVPSIILHLVLPNSVNQHVTHDVTQAEAFLGYDSSGAPLFYSSTSAPMFAVDTFFCIILPYVLTLIITEGALHMVVPVNATTDLLSTEVVSNLEELLATKHGFASFFNFLKTEFTMQNLLYWRACKNFQAAIDDHRYLLRNITESVTGDPDRAHHRHLFHLPAGAHAGDIDGGMFSGIGSGSSGEGAATGTGSSGDDKGIMSELGSGTRTVHQGGLNTRNSPRNSVLSLSVNNVGLKVRNAAQLAYPSLPMHLQPGVPASMVGARSRTVGGVGQLENTAGLPYPQRNAYLPPGAISPSVTSMNSKFASGNAAAAANPYIAIAQGFARSGNVASPMGARFPGQVAEGSTLSLAGSNPNGPTGAAFLLPPPVNAPHHAGGQQGGRGHANHASASVGLEMDSAPISPEMARAEAANPALRIARLQKQAADLAVEHTRLHAMKLLEKARSIHDRFVRDGAPYEVSDIAGPLRDAILEFMSLLSFGFKSPVDQLGDIGKIFIDSQEFVYDLLSTDAFPRYLKSPFFLNFKSNARARAALQQVRIQKVMRERKRAARAAADAQPARMTSTHQAESALMSGARQGVGFSRLGSTGHAPAPSIRYASMPLQGSTLGSTGAGGGHMRYGRSAHAAAAGGNGELDRDSGEIELQALTSQTHGGYIRGSPVLSGLQSQVSLRYDHNPLDSPGVMASNGVGEGELTLPPRTHHPGAVLSSEDLRPRRFSERANGATLPRERVDSMSSDSADDLMAHRGSLMVSQSHVVGEDSPMTDSPMLMSTGRDDRLQHHSGMPSGMLTPGMESTPTNVDRTIRLPLSPKKPPPQQQPSQAPVVVHAEPPPEKEAQHLTTTSHTSPSGPRGESEHGQFSVDPSLQLHHQQSNSLSVSRTGSIDIDKALLKAQRTSTATTWTNGTTTGNPSGENPSVVSSNYNSSPNKSVDRHELKRHSNLDQSMDSSSAELLKQIKQSSARGVRP